MADKRWSCEKRAYVDTPKIDAFLNVIEQVCIEHGFLISHEDGGGAFEIVDLTEKNKTKYLEWLKEAHDRTGQG